MSSPPDPTPNGAAPPRPGDDALRRSEERYRALVEATSQAVWSWAPGAPHSNFEQTQRWWEEVTGQTLDEQRGSDTAWLDVVHPDDRAAAGAAWAAALATGVPYDVEYRVRARAGGWRFVKARGVPIPGPDGAPREWVGTLNDVTDQRRAEADARRATAAAERQRRVYETALSNTADFVYLFDPDGRFTFVNKALLDLWRTDLAAVVGKDFRALDYPPALAARLLRQVREVAATRRPLRDEAPYTGPAGPRSYEHIFVPVVGADGAVEAVAGSARDVTDRKRAEEELARLADTLRLALDAGGLGTWEWDPATDGITLSPKAGEVYGVEPGRPHPREQLRALLHPDHRDRARAEAARAAAARTDYDIEYPLATGRWVAARGRGVYAPDGTLTRVIGVVQDVTERKRAEEALRASEAEFRATFEGAGVGKAQADPATGRLTRVNPKLCELLGYAADELLGMTIRELTHPDERAESDARFRALVAGEVGQYAVEKRYLRKGGDVVWVRVTATVVRAPDGTPVRASAIIEDVTARTLAEAALKDADRKKDDFIALLAHELRNPLAPVRTGLRVVRLADDRAVRERALDVMDRQLGHMVRLIDDLLDVSRITRNKMELRRARVALADVVGSAVETARPALDEAGHELTVSLPARPVYLDADLTRLSQVLSNLLTNSARYTPRGGRVWLAAGRVAGAVEVSVRDTGVGIPADALPRVFDMFSQADRALERSTGGLGIGLALVKGLVEMHGGAVAAHSDGHGRGSTFVVTLPALPDAPDPAAAPAAGGGRAGPARRVLVADDNRDGADSLAEMLRLMGHEAATAHDGLEAVERAGHFRPDLILMDVGMPRLNGLDATRRIREHPWGRGITIVALTGWGQDADRERTRAAGCDAHLVKPVDLSDLEKVLAGPRPAAG